MIQEFHAKQPAIEVEKGLTKFCKAEKYRLDKGGPDPLNDNFYKLCLFYQDLVVWLRERSSTWLRAPMMIFDRVHKFLEEEWGTIGTILNSMIDKAIRKLEEDPEAVLPSHHLKTREQILEIRAAGENLSLSTYRLILERMKKKATMKELPYEMSGWMLNEVTGSRGKWGVNRDTRKANNTVISTDFSALTLNTSTTGQTSRARPCGECGLFHPEHKGKECLFYDRAQNRFKVKAFIKHRTVRQIHGDGTSSANEYWMSKLRKFSFPAMGITREEDKQKVIKDIKAAIAELPEATVEERRKYKEENTRFINMAKVEYEGLTPVKVLAAIVENPKALTKSQKQNRKRKEKRERKREEADDSSEGPDSGNSSDGDSYGSEDGHRF